MRGAPGEVGPRQPSLYRGSAAFPRRHAATTTRPHDVLDAPIRPLTPRHWTAEGAPALTGVQPEGIATGGGPRISIPADWAGPISRPTSNSHVAGASSCKGTPASRMKPSKPAGV